MSIRSISALTLIAVSLVSAPVFAQGQKNLTVAVLINSQNTTGYNTSTANPGEFQRFAESYLMHLQVPYEIFDVATVSPPDLSSRQLIVSGHSHLSLSGVWSAAIIAAVNGGTGFVNLDSDPGIGSQPHITTIFSATGAISGTAATQISIPAAVAPGGATPHYIAALQQKLDGGSLVYPFHAGSDGVTRSATSTLLQNAQGTVIALLGSDPLIRAVTFGSGRAVHFGTLDYLHGDRFGFVMGLDDLFWRSLVWAARKPFALRGYPRFWAVQMDDTKVNWGQRMVDMFDTSLTGTVSVDGVGGPWKVTGYVYTDNLAKGSADRTAAISAINAGKLRIAPHSFGDVNCGNMFWNGCNGPLTDALWQTNMAAIDAWKAGNGGTDTIPALSRSLVAHFWDLSNNTGFDLWNHYGFRYITSIQKAGFQSTLNNNGAERLPVRPYWSYEMPPKMLTDPNFPTETYPFFFADDYTVSSRAGLPAQTFFLFATQYFDTTKYSRPDFEWPNALATPAPTAASSVGQLKQYTWRQWSGMSPVQLFTHDSLNYENSSIQDRQTVIAQGSQWLTANGVRHIFMDDLGDYIYARTKSVLTGAIFDGSQIAYTYTGRAATADGNLIPTQVLLFQGDNEGAWQTVPGFTNGLQVSRSLPPAVLSVTPSSGLTTGGTTVTITGSGFSADSTVAFGQNNSPSVTFVNSNTLQAVAPAGLPATVDVKVINSNGSAVLPGAFTYVTPPRVLVAAYGLNEGSGTTVADTSGNGNNGTITSATWSANGKFGKALSFNGTNSWVTIPDSTSLHLSNGMTIEAWVNPTTNGGWRNVLIKEQTGGMVYALYASTDTNQPSGHVFLATENSIRGTSAVPANTWTHLAATYNGVILRLYVNGVEVANKSLNGNITQANGVLRIGGDSIWGEFFSGLIDEVRIYNEPSTAAEIQSDMATPLGDGVPPTVSITAPANGATVTGPVTVSANASDNVGVAGVQFLLDGAALGAEVVTPPYTITWNTSGTVNGAHTLTARARDGAGNQTISAVVNVTTSNAAPDTTSPTVSITAPANGATVTGSITVSANASDNVGVVGVQFQLDGAALGAEVTTPPYSISWNTATVINGLHTLAARARDAAGNVATSTSVSVTVTGGMSGLVAAYGFNEGSGTTVADLSGKGNNGTVTATTWSTAGKFGGALSFNGTSSWVTVPDSASLDLTAGMTLEAWVNPSALTAWRTVIFKEQTGELIYSLYANSDTNQPTGHVFVGTEFNTRGTAAVSLNTWTHLATTYDGTTLRLFVNGAQVSNKVVGGNMNTSTGVLRMGGNSIWGEFYAGLIDEVRIYNRPLSASEIQADMNTAVGAAPDTTPPTVSLTAPANGSTVSSTVTVSANASDNIGVAGVQFLLDGAALGAEDTTASYSISWDSTTTANGTHTLSARARDGAGNQTTSTVVNITVSNDTTPPTASLTAPGNGSTVSGTVTVSANASDNIGVAGVQFLLDGAALSAEDTTAPYSISWDSTTTANGTHTLSARARDGAGNQTTSTVVNVTVSNTDATPPAISMTAPANNATVSGTVTVSANASDNVSVAGVQFLLDGAALGAEDTASPYTISWNTAAVANGVHTLSARARDAAGNQTTSIAVNITVSNDTTPPTASMTAPANGATVSGTVTVSASASDNVGVVGVQFLLDGGALGTEDTTAPYSISWNTTAAANGLHALSVRVRDAAGNQTTSTAVSVTVSNTAPDTTPPSVSVTAPANGATVSGSVTVSANASDNVGVAGVQFLLDSAPLGTEVTTAPYSISWNSATATNGSHTLSARARDAAGNQTTSTVVNVTVNGGVSGLVAAYSFNEGAGTTVTDLSGMGNNGTITGAVWSTGGKYGNALSFNGSNNWVTIPDSVSLDLTSGMTLEAWVRPSALGSVWRTVVMKEQTAGLIYALYANTDTTRPSGHVFITAENETRGTAAVSTTAFTHLAVTYDGATLRLYVNGVQASSKAVAGPIKTSTGLVRIGGNNIWGEWFAGLIDEVRIYNRALSAAEIQSDMAAPLVP